MRAAARDAVPIGTTATLDQLKGNNVELLKSHLEGKYEQK